jgi:hypothetical protein
MSPCKSHDKWLHKWLHKSWSLAPVVIGMISNTLALAQDRDTPATDEAVNSSYVRVIYQREEPRALQTSVTRFVPQAGENELVVDLVAAVHLGDRLYYKRLNQLLKRYDVVLYELVAPSGEEVPDLKDGDNPLRVMHRLMQSVLGLSSQLEEVEYTSDNFVHADMSPAEMSAALKSRGETPVTFALSAFADILRQANVEAQRMASEKEQPANTQQDVLTLLTSRKGGIDLKRQMALQLSRMGGSAAALGPTIGQLLVSDRNGAAMKVFQHELAKGNQRIAIFYGAAHMPDFQKRLEDDFGLTHARTEWITAWDLNQATTIESPLSAFLRLLQ